MVRTKLDPAFGHELEMKKRQGLTPYVFPLQQYLLNASYSFKMVSASKIYPGVSGRSRINAPRCLQPNLLFLR